MFLLDIDFDIECMLCEMLPFFMNRGTYIPQDDRATVQTGES